jgi:hypothetical protein
MIYKFVKFHAHWQLTNFLNFFLNYTFVGNLQVREFSTNLCRRVCAVLLKHNWLCRKKQRYRTNFSNFLLFVASMRKKGKQKTRSAQPVHAECRIWSKNVASVLSLRPLCVHVSNLIFPSVDQEPMLWLFKYFRGKIRPKNWRFWLKTKVIFFNWS